MSVFYAFLTSVLLTFVPSDNVPYNKVKTAIENNDSRGLVDISKDKLIISVLGSEGVYGHSQAELILKDFFAKNPGNKFEFTFKGRPTSEGVFAIGNYDSNGGKYRITIHFKKIGSDFKLESFTIEK